MAIRKLTRCSLALALCLSALAGRADDNPKDPDPKDPPLRRELLRRFQVDQDARLASMNFCKQHGIIEPSAADKLTPQQKAEFEALADRLKKVDIENTRWLKDMVENRGWPTRTLVSKDGAMAAWLLIQHADDDPKFQRKCLDLMNALPKQEVSAENVAYLTDRVLLAEGKKQVYGTQLTRVDGKLQPRPLEDEANVDKHRAAVGLSSLADYLKQAQEVYGGAK